MIEKERLKNRLSQTSVESQVIIILLNVQVMLWGVSVARGMEIGAGGGWDSPMATDYWVKRFGFMWGGGSSGMSGLKAVQVTKIYFTLTCLAPVILKS